MGGNVPTSTLQHSTKLGGPCCTYSGPWVPLLLTPSCPSSPVVAQQEKTPPPRPNLLEAGGDGCEEPKEQVSWEQEFLVGNSPGGSGRALCMVCGAEIQSPSADTARMHILEQHPHTLDLSPSEKSNILEAWSEGVALLQDVRAEQPSSPTSGSWNGGDGRGWGGSGGLREKSASRSIWSSLGVCPLQTQARMSKLTRTPTQTLPKCQQRSSFSSTLRTTQLSQKGAGPGDSAPSSFLVSLQEAFEAELGRGEHAPCVLCGEGLRGSGVTPF